MPYVDGFVLPVPKKNLKAYFAMAKKASKIWQEHGALDCMGRLFDESQGTHRNRER